MEGDVTDGTGSPAGKRVFCLYQPLEGDVRGVNPAILWDLEPIQMDETELSGLDEIEALIQDRQVIEDHLVTEVLLPFREEIAQRREHEAQIKAKYGLRSLDYLIQESNQKILDYQTREALGEAVELPLLNEQRNLEKLVARREALEQEIRLERELTVGEPRFLGAAAVIPLGLAQTPYQQEELTERAVRNGKEPQERYQVAPSDQGVDAERKAEIEAVGMQVAMDYERQHGWHPEDVSGENHGFDVRSNFYDDEGAFADVRYIEVKARARSGAIRLSANEWKKARHFDVKFWLYIVTEAGTDEPQLSRIQNPASHFQEGEDIFATGFIIHESNWRTAQATPETE